MTITEEILQELRRGRPLAEIRQKFRSQSQLYEALRIFLEEVDKKIEETEKRLVERKKELEEVERSLFELEAERNRLNSEREKVLGELRELVQEKEQLASTVSHLSEELDRLNANIVELREKGFTPKILKQIRTVIDRTGPQVLLQLESAEQYIQINKEIARLKRKKATLERRIRTLKSKIAKIREMLVTEKNKYDELERQTATFREALATVSHLFKSGFSTEDIKSLAHGLGVLGISGDPLASITRLVHGLAKQKSLFALEEKISEKRKEFGLLKNACADAKSELNVARTLEKAFRDVRDAGLQAIVLAAEKANERMENATANFERRVENSSEKFDINIRRTIEGVRAELGEWGQLQEQKGRLRETIGPGVFLLGILRSTEFLKEVPLPLVVHLFKRLHIWSEMNLSDVSIRPSENIQRKQFNLAGWQLYSLPVLIEFVSEGLETLLIERSKQA